MNNSYYTLNLFIEILNSVLYLSFDSITNYLESEEKQANKTQPEQSFNFLINLILLSFHIFLLIYPLI